MESGQAERRIVVPYNLLGGVTLPELRVGIVGRDSHLDTEMLISVGATLAVALTCGCYCFGQAQDLPLRLHDFLT